MKQVCIVHGGSTFESEREYLEDLGALEMSYKRLLYGRRWKNWLGEQLTGYDVLMPEMPNKAYAKYEEWALLFSKVVPFLRKDAILIGHSLGGIFLAKYLNERPNLHFSKVALISAPFDSATSESLASFSLPEDLDKLSNRADSFALFHSRDDKVVAFDELAKYAEVIPEAVCYELDERGHFNQETFPELLEFIKK